MLIAMFLFSRTIYMMITFFKTVIPVIRTIDETCFLIDSLRAINLLKSLDSCVRMFKVAVISFEVCLVFLFQHYDTNRHKRSIWKFYHQGKSKVTTFFFISIYS